MIKGSSPKYYNSVIIQMNLMKSFKKCSHFTHLVLSLFNYLFNLMTISFKLNNMRMSK